MKTNLKESVEDYIQKELTYVAHNYLSVPVVLNRGKGVFLYDIEDKRYYDFLGAYSSVNQGHCHPDILNVMIEQAKQLTVCSRAFHSNALAECAQFLSELFHYDKVLMMNSGAEANDTAYKLCRRWGYEIKKIPTDTAKIVFCKSNFSGRTLACISASSDKACTHHFGPFVPNFIKIPYDNLEELEKVIKDPTVCAFIVEPIQGEAGVIIPSNNYLKGAYELCKKYNVLFVADEVQTGLGRTGTLLCSNDYGVRPDVVLLGKAMSGGYYPISAVLADDNIMLVIKPGDHGSTYGGNPLAAVICMEAIKVILRENLCENARVVGDYFLKALKKEFEHCKIIREIRGKGLLCAIELRDDLINAWEVCLKLAENGLLTKSVHDKTLRFAPPLCITKEQINECFGIISKTFKHFEK